MRLRTVRIIAFIGLVLDVWFHWLEERNIWEFLVDDFFEAENEARWEEFIFGGTIFIRGLSLTAHILLLAALLALIAAPYLIWEVGGFLKLRLFQVLASIGLVVDFVFHWLEQGSPADFLLDDFFEGSVFFRGLSLAAHIAFVTALLFLIFAKNLIYEFRLGKPRY